MKGIEVILGRLLIDIHFSVNSLKELWLSANLGILLDHIESVSNKYGYKDKPWVLERRTEVVIDELSILAMRELH